MRLQISRSRNAESFYAIKSVYAGGKRTTIVYEKLGTLAEVREKAGGQDPYEWARAYVKELTRREKEEAEESICLELSPNQECSGEERHQYKFGHLFLQKLFYQLGWNHLSQKVKAGTDSEIPLNAILQMLLYTRILYPRSKKASWELNAEFLPPAREEKMELHQVYRALDLIAEKSDLIQELVYKSTENHCKRNTDVLYYDCTNFFFEIEEEDEFRRYGRSKEHRPNPIVQMGMFIDGDGIPLAVTCFPGNESEQPSLKPLEQKILSRFDLSRFVVCTDAGLASTANRRFNSRGDRRYVVTQSLKTLPGPVQEWALEPLGWFMESDEQPGRQYDLTRLDERKDRDRLFFKEQIVEIGGLAQRMVVTYSIKSRDYQRSVRQRQINRAVRTVTKTPQDMEHRQENDFRRFVQTSFLTEEGETSTRKELHLDEEAIAREERFDGFYAVCANLPPITEENPDGVSVTEILRINHMRWQIEDCFRDLKSEFKSRPVYLSRENRIRAHFLLCSLSLILLKYLEKTLRDSGFTNFTTESLLSCLRGMTILHLRGYGYIPTTNPSPIGTALQQAFGLPLSRQIISEKTMKKMIAVSPQA